ncbi:MAG: hypothetical protein ACLQAH_18065 [Limisphaerales bacterium]
MSNEAARGQYESLMAKGQARQEKQWNSVSLDGTEIAEFEKHCEVLLANPMARGFLDAREDLHQIRHSIQKHISKTLEQGRVPGETDFEDESCGHGCGCHH